MSRSCFAVALVLAGGLPTQAAEPLSGKPTLLSVQKIWDKAPHNAFTDLIRHSGRHLMVNIGVAGGAPLRATDHHPFWSITAGDFVDAINLHVGDKLQASDGASGNVYGYYSALAAKTALVGAYTATVDGEAKRGAAYFYTREE